MKHLGKCVYIYSHHHSHAVVHLVHIKNIVFVNLCFLVGFTVIIVQLLF